MENIIALKDLRLNIDKYVQGVKSRQSFVVVKQSKPIFRISPLEDDGRWEEVTDFTKLKKGDLTRLDIKRLKGQSGIFRVSKGKFRIIYCLSNSKIKILSLERRSDNTYNLK
ncbi:hypothetical protein JXE04_02415 [Patescibacteria group bacterium]|nr:hypothetical protein [Patescibacteria group bacterium]